MSCPSPEYHKQRGEICPYLVLTPEMLESKFERESHMAEINYCPHCGKELKRKPYMDDIGMMTCPRCGDMNINITKFKAK